MSDTNKKEARDTHTSQKVISKLQEILGEQYELARNSIIYSEVISSELHSTSVIQFRDALDHIRRAMISEDETQALNELDYASEHIRLAGVEGIQTTAFNLFYDAVERSKMPDISYRIVYGKTFPREKVQEQLEFIKNLLIEAKMKKVDSNEWIKSVQLFMKSIELTLKLNRMLPSKEITRKRILLYVTMSVSILSTVVAIISVVWGG